MRHIIMCAAIPPSIGFVAVSNQVSAQQWTEGVLPRKCRQRQPKRRLN